MAGPTLRPGMSFAQFRISSHLGSGGMGEVYQAYDTKLDRHVALKILPPSLVENRERVKRFTREAKAASALNHPHLVAIYDIGEAELDLGRVHYIAMELIEGQTLRRAIADGIQLRRGLEILGQAANALARAHDAGIVHRDLK